MASAMTRPWIGNLGENIKQGKRSRHPTGLLALESTRPGLYVPSLLANVNLSNRPGRSGRNPLLALTPIPRLCTLPPLLGTALPIGEVTA